MPRRFTPVFAGTAKRQLAVLPEKAATAAIEFIFGDLADNPHRVGRALRGPLRDKHKATRGTYRIIYVIHEDAAEVEIQDIVLRSDAYRGR